MANLDLSNSFLSENDERVLKEYWGILLKEGYLDRGNNALTKYENGVQNDVIVSRDGRMSMSSYKIIVDGKYPSFCSFQRYYFSGIDNGEKFKVYATEKLLQSEMLTFKSIAFKQASNSMISIISKSGFDFKEIDDKGIVKYAKLGKDGFNYEFTINHTAQNMLSRRVGPESVQENSCDFDDVNNFSTEEIFIKLSNFPISY